MSASFKPNCMKYSQQIIYSLTFTSKCCVVCKCVVGTIMRHYMVLMGPHDIQHDNTQHNGTQDKEFVTTLGIRTLT